MSMCPVIKASAIVYREDAAQEKIRTKTMRKNITL
jgi:hypothetical protein